MAVGIAVYVSNDIIRLSFSEMTSIPRFYMRERAFR